MVEQSAGPRVIVLGAGPAGLASAGALAMKGVQVIVLDRAPDGAFRADGKLFFLAHFAQTVMGEVD